MSGESSAIGGLRQPEYTGENRCVPCTAVNLVVAIAASLLLSLVAVPLAIAAFAVSLVAIYLRGYLVPGTPTLTKRYLPDAVLARFDHADGHPAATQSAASRTADARAGSGPGTPDAVEGNPAVDHDLAADGDSSDDDSAAEQEWETLQKIEHHRENEVDPETFLRDAGAIEDAGDDDHVTAADHEAPNADREVSDGPGVSHGDHDVADGDLALTDDFRERVDDHQGTLRDEGVPDEALGELFEVDAAAVEHVDRDYPAIKVEHRIRQWPSEAAFVADVAAHRALDARTDDWLGIPLEQRIDVLESLRSFRDGCPLCGGAVVGDESVVDSCCRSFDVVTIACEDCDARLLELPAHATDDVSAPDGTLH